MVQQLKFLKDFFEREMDRVDPKCQQYKDAKKLFELSKLLSDAIDELDSIRGGDDDIELKMVRLKMLEKDLKMEMDKYNKGV